MRPDAVLPIMLNAARLRVLVVGGGAVAARKVRKMLDAGVTSITVVAPQIGAAMPAAVQGVRIVRERFRAEHLAGANLVLAATDDETTNAAVAVACEQGGILCSRADQSAAGDWFLSALANAGGIVLSLSTGTPSLAKRSLAAAAAAVAPMAELAAAAEKLRPAILAAAPDDAARRAAMHDLTSEEAEAILAEEGPDGLRAWIAGRYAWFADPGGES